jgi:hypothetical protein
MRAALVAVLLATVLLCSGCNRCPEGTTLIVWQAGGVTHTACR